MVIINKGQSNAVTLTLTEKVSLSVPYFLFRFVSDDTNVEKTFIMPNTSIYTNRYDEFNLIEGTTVTLSPTGFYHYYVYEQASAVNLNYLLSGALLEAGKVKVIGTTVTEPVTEFTAVDEYKAFEG